MRRRSHRRTRRRSGSPVISAVVLVLIIGIVGFSVLPAASYTTSEIGRDASANVVADEKGIHALEIADNVSVGTTSRLVTVTNQLGTDVTVTVTLHDASAEYGDLIVDGVNETNEATFDLAAGTSQAVDIEVVDDSTLDGEQLYFDTSASAPGLSVEATNRSTTITT